jgi:DNA-binding transcriptional ArsR family regulator
VVVGTDFAAVGRLLSAPARSAILDALLDGREHSAGELAQVAGVATSTTSEHLQALVGGGLVRQRRSGRHRFYSVTDERVAEALEVLGQLCPDMPVRSLRESRARDALQVARTCYDHLAGQLGVALHDAYVECGWLDDGSLAVTDRGRRGFQSAGVAIEELEGGRRRLTRPCLDWTERRTHVAGALGAAVAIRFFELGWIRRRPADRGLVVTQPGARGFAEHYGIELQSLVNRR